MRREPDVKPVTCMKTRARQATLLLRLLAQGEADVREGRTFPQDKVFKALRGRLAKR